MLRIQGVSFEGEVGTMAKKSVPFTKRGIEELPNDKPVVYKIRNQAGDNVYTGVAKRNRVNERLQEHLAGGKDHVPGSTVEIQQKASIDEAKATETRIISRDQPKFNDKGK
jgi:excinuclease UvrABC nuclease subunit